MTLGPSTSSTLIKTHRLRSPDLPELCSCRGRIRVHNEPMTPAGNRVGELRETGKPVTLKVRAARDEQDAFSEAAKLTGLSWSAWLRFVCRAAATAQLKAAGKRVSWL